MAESSIETYRFCEQIMTQHEENHSREVICNFQLIDEFAKQYHLLKQKLPYHINLIDELHVNENANSRILASLLLYNCGGKYPLLDSFVNYCIGNWDIEISHPQVTSEQMRIDLLVREKGKYAIIFENKIYEAILQKNQIARYIQKLRQEGFQDEQIYVVFLPPYEYEPDSCSWQEPKRCCDSCDRAECQIGSNPELRVLFKERFKIVTFREDIISWLKDEVIPNCKQKEVYLYTAAMQYLDYLEGYFDLRTNNKKMSMELKDFLFEKLQLHNLRDEERLEIINKKTEEINRLLNQMNSIKDEISDKLVKQDAKEWISYSSKMQNIISEVGKQLSIKAELVFIDPENCSHLYIKFYKDDWDLSIVFEIWGKDRNRHQNMFVYIGIPIEQVVDLKYSDHEKIFREKSEKTNHPYGWEWIDIYNQKPESLQKDIDNGQFRSYLFNKVAEILKLIEQKELPMA